MRIAICYNEPTPGDIADEDVLVQVDEVSVALRELGYQCLHVPCTLDLGAMVDTLSRIEAHSVFNLVEALGGTDRLAVLVPEVLEATGVPYTGVQVPAFRLLVDKLATRQLLESSQIAVPRCGTRDFLPGRYIIKARYEHASVGMDDSAVVNVSTREALLRQIRQRADNTGFEMISEAFVDGREFNVSLLGNSDGSVKVLTPAEIDFAGFPAHKPRIVGYDAKWMPASFEYGATPRRFDFPPEDSVLINTIKAQCEAVWVTFGLTGYARVDIRVDATGTPYVVDINPNPCLSHDAGFQAALAQDGTDFTEAVAAIMALSFA